MALQIKDNSHTRLQLQLRPVHNHTDSIMPSNLHKPTTDRVTKSKGRLGGRRLYTGPPKLGG